MGTPFAVFLQPAPARAQGQGSALATIAHRIWSLVASKNLTTTWPFRRQCPHDAHFRAGFEEGAQLKVGLRRGIGLYNSVTSGRVLEPAKLRRPPDLREVPDCS
jgi:hypothetical protein